jgi:LEA14-like dessication related protein
MLRSIRTVIALLIVACCAQAAQEKKPTIKLKSISVKQVSVAEQTAETSVTIEIENPGPAYKIKDASYKLKLNGQAAAEGKRSEEINVPSDSTVTVDLPVTVNLSALPGVTWSAVADGLNLSYELETEFTIPALAMFDYKVKTAFTGELPVGGSLISLPGKLVDRIFSKP